MKYVIIDIPEDSIKLIEQLGYGRIKCFVSDETAEHSNGIPIVPFECIADLAKENIIIIPLCEKSQEYVAMLQAMGIKRFYALKQKFILFGAGTDGMLTFLQLGESRVHCFLDNYKSGTTVLGKPVISFDQLHSLLDKYTIMITSSAHQNELVQQLEDHEINHYTFLYDVLPQYSLYKKSRVMSYEEVLANYNITKYRKIAIYGANDLLPELICELAFRNSIDQIVGIIDPTGRWEKMKDIMGIPFGTLTEFEMTIDCLILSTSRAEDGGLRNKFEIEKPSYEIVDMFDVDKFIPTFYFPELQRYKNKHKGQRVFLIGNGPSLRTEDLNTLHEHGEICFGLNKIYRAYDRTKWRATYYCLNDPDVIVDCGDEVDQLQHGEDVFYGDSFHIVNDAEPKYMRKYVHVSIQSFFPNKPAFSDDLTKGIVVGYGTMYDMALQIAAYMGFSEIYLLGTDWSFTGKITNVKNHFIPDYFRECEEKRYEKKLPPEVHLGIKSFEKAEEYSRQHGFRIFNATRGGALEVFERVDFDSLFK